MLAAGCWLVGCWLQAVNWLQAAGCWLLANVWLQALLLVEPACWLLADVMAAGCSCPFFNYHISLQVVNSSTVVGRPGGCREVPGWLLVAGDCMLAAGCWLAGCRLLVARKCLAVEPACWLLAVHVHFLARSRR